ncbi:MAG: hypothetical protein EP343_11115 [Deltaproteobacteria bacterium]|nr:MAG: hypothetical protein EP343_11115 [Deltaproteobacteria bacterium]
MSKYQVYLYFFLVALATAALGAVVWNMLLPSDASRRLHTRKTWTVFVFFLGVIVFTLGLFVYFTVGTYKTPTAVLHGIGIGLILTVVLVGTYSPGEAFAGKGLFFNGLTIVATAAVLAIVVAINFYVRQKEWKYDFNQDKLESLHDETVKVLKNLKEPITVTAFLYKREKQQEQMFLNFFEKYRSVNRKMFNIRVVDPMASPLTAKCYDVKGDFGGQLRNRIVISRGGKCRTTKTRTYFAGKKIVISNRLSEKEVTNKLIRLTRTKAKTICFLRGRRQPSITASNDFSFKEFNKLLTEKGFKTREVNLLSVEKVPPQCELVIHAVPEWTSLYRSLGTQQGAMKTVVRLDDTEVERLQKYLDQGGKMMLFLEPLAVTGLEDMLKSKFGIEKKEGVVLDFLLNARGQGGRARPFFPVAVDFSRAHPITKDSDSRKGARVIFRWASPVSKSKAIPAGVAVSELVRTIRGPYRARSKAGKLLKDCCSFYLPTPLSKGFQILMANSSQLQRRPLVSRLLNGLAQESDPGALPGPFSLVTAAAKKGARPNQETRIVVFGDSSVATNSGIVDPYSQNLVFNSLAWLVKEKDLVHIVTKRRKPSNVQLTTTQKDALRLTARYGIPLFFSLIIMMVFGIRRQK